MKNLLLALLLSLASILAMTSPASASVDDFIISRFAADYQLSKLQDGRSSLTVTETIVAEFPNFNQNKGIVRAIPEKYNNFSLEFELLEVTRNGQPEPVYDRTLESDNHIIALGTDDYLQGRQTYQLRYQLENVITTYDGYQEFFWNVNGTQWRQPISDVSARVTIDESVGAAFQDSRCFQGREGSTQTCTIALSDNGLTAVARSTRLMNINENISIALKLPEGSFALPAKTLAHFMPFILLGIACILFVMLVIILVRYGRDHPGRGLVPVQYLPPKDIPVLIAAKVHGVYAKVLPATLVDLAVRDILEIIDHRDEDKKGEYSVRVTDAKAPTLHASEITLLTTLFSTAPSPGVSFRFAKKLSTSQQATARSVAALLVKTSRPTSTTDTNYRHHPKALQLAWIPLLSVFAGFFFWSEYFDYAPLISGITAVLSIGLVILALTTLSRHPLTEQGRELHDYLEGLRRYIKLAETDRIAFLQSVKGAQRKQSVVQLYERVLPYAILFNLEKSWVKTLQLHYTEDSQHSPQWLRGATIASLPSTIGSFSTSTSGYGFTSSSSAGSSGFSGGGSSGGGGGGGGGGGR